MTTLILFIAIAVFVSFLCSVLEAVILSLTPGYIHSLKETQTKTYNRILPLKDNIERPLAAILTLNTFAHTIGATGAGASALKVFGNAYVTLFSVILTLIILIFSEIIPKSIGARYWKELTPFATRVLPILINLSWPLVWLSEKLSKVLKGSAPIKLTRDEVSAMAEIGFKDGALNLEEYGLLKNMLSFPDKPVSEIAKDVENVYCLSHKTSLDEVFEFLDEFSYTRIPIIGESKNDVRGYIMKDSVFWSKAKDQSQDIDNLIKPMLHVPEHAVIGRVFKKLIKRREHIAGVFSEDGSFMGIITLEDIIESLLGLDIKDETDDDDD
jgi:CBS domain containing-hemolysin-like protein